MSHETRQTLGIICLLNALVLLLSIAWDIWSLPMVTTPQAASDALYEHVMKSSQQTLIKAEHCLNDD